MCSRPAALAVLLAASTSLAQLYGDPKAVKDGDLNDQDYWWARFDDLMLDVCGKQAQPQGHIGYVLVSTNHRLDELTKKYPVHAGIAKLKRRAEQAAKGIDPQAPDRTAPFGPDCPWEQSNFGQLWVNLHWGQTAWAEKDYTSAQGSIYNVKRNLEVLLEPNRLSAYPAELAKYVRDAKPEAERLDKLISEKLTVASGPAVKAEPGVTTGDLDNQDYWWARYDDMMLDVALKARQPEGHIGYQLVSVQKRLDELSVRYPAHDGIKEMKKRAATIAAMIDPKADRTAPFTPEVPWEESNFAQLWVNLHHARAAHEKKNDSFAAGLLGSIAQNQKLLLAPNRMKNYPPELKKWVEDSQAELAQLSKDVKAGRGRK